LNHAGHRPTSDKRNSNSVPADEICQNDAPVSLLLMNSLSCHEKNAFLRFDRQKTAKAIDPIYFYPYCYILGAGYLQ
jgi:hypothetical protein